jgi:hypothetical protein
MTAALEELIVGELFANRANLNFPVLVTVTDKVTHESPGFMCGRCLRKFAGAYAAFSTEVYYTDTPPLIFFIPQHEYNDIDEGVYCT